MFTSANAETSSCYWPAPSFRLFGLHHGSMYLICLTSKYGFPCSSMTLLYYIVHVKDLTSFRSLFFKNLRVSSTLFLWIYYTSPGYTNTKNHKWKYAGIDILQRKFILRRKNQKWASTRQFRIWQLLWTFEVFGNFLVTFCIFLLNFAPKKVC